MHDVREEFMKSVCIFVFFFFLLSLKQQDKWQCACFALLFCYDPSIHYLSCSRKQLILSLF